MQSLINQEPIEPVFPSSKDEQKHKEFLESPYLLKIILTNFPAEPNEIVKDLEYKDRIVFSQDELKEFTHFVHENLQKHAGINKVLKQGTIFFLRLGQGKKEMLDRDYEDLKKGVEYSMNTLKRLQKVYINNEDITKQPLELEEFEIEKTSEEFRLISPEYKECNIKIAFGYYRDYKQSGKIKNAPNFYKYFPMGDETNGFSFIVHCDAFSNEANRRKLQKDETNKNLLPVIAKCILTKLETYKKTNREQFLRLYVALLLSDIPNKQNNEWLKPIFHDILMNYLRSNIPTYNNQFSDSPEKVKINTLETDIHLEDFGLGHIQWFEWQSKNDHELVREAKNKEKLDIEAWDFSDILQNCDISKTNDFILKLYNSDRNRYGKILNLINEITELEWTKNNDKLYNKFSQLTFFPYQKDNKIYLASLADCIQNNIIILQHKHKDLQPILEKLGFTVSSQTINIELAPINKIICEKISYIKNEAKFYEIVSKKCALKANYLNTNEKHILFNYLIDLQGVGDETVKKLILFSDSLNQLKPLFQLVDSALSTPEWLNAFKIKAEENSKILKKYLISEKEVYQGVILPNWDKIISEITNVTEFYSKIKFYYDQDDKNTPLKNQAFVFVNESERFIPANDVFYNSKFAQIGFYEYFQEAIYKLTDTRTPQKNILKYLKEAPFKVENSNLFDYTINDDIELSFEELNSVIQFCKANNENFFQNCIIEKQGQNFIVSEKYDNMYQVRPSKKELKAFIEENLDENFKILPHELDEYKDEKGIIQGEELYQLVVNKIDVDELKEDIVDILAYDEAKRQFLLKLSEICLVSGESYTEQSVEYKILELACNILKDTADIQKFREKITIETDEQSLKLSQIPPFSDKIKIQNCELNLAKILPSSYQNSDYLGELIGQFTSIGIDKNRLNALLGITQEPDIEHIFNLFSEEITVIENAEQLAFLFLYAIHIDEVDFAKFNVLNVHEEEVSLEFDKYLNSFDFIDPSETLHSDYLSISKYIKDFPIVVDYADNLLLIKEPYFEEGNFICPYIIEDMSDGQKLSFIEFLFNQWSKKNKKTAIRDIDWACIGEIETEKLLGFNPNYSVYPSEYALESEQLPQYLQDWLGEDIAKINFIADVGVFTEGSTLLELRKFFNNENQSFKKSKIAQDTRLEDEKMLFNTFELLKENNLELSTTEEFEVFEEMVRVINTNRTSDGLIIQTEYDFELLENNAHEWDASYYQTWKQSIGNKYSIFLYDGELPKVVKLDEIENYIFYRFNEENAAIDDQNRIFVNAGVDIKKALLSLALDSKIEFSSEDLLLLYQSEGASATEYNVQELLNRIEFLSKRIEELEGFSGRASYDPTISMDQTYHRKIREKSEAYVFELLKKTYPKNRIIWFNYDEKTGEFKESLKHHDFEIQDKNGNILYYIDCKGTPYDKKTFYLTDNEWHFFLECVRKGKNYQIYRVFNVEGNMTYTLIDNLWEWIKAGKVVPYLTAEEIIKGGRVFLTLLKD